MFLLSLCYFRDVGHSLWSECCVKSQNTVCLIFAAGSILKNCDASHITDQNWLTLELTFSSREEPKESLQIPSYSFICGNPGPSPNEYRFSLSHACEREYHAEHKRKCKIILSGDDYASCFQIRKHVFVKIKPDSSDGQSCTTIIKKRPVASVTRKEIDTADVSVHTCQSYSTPAALPVLFTVWYKTVVHLFC